jgi:hypothetical protein
MTGENRRDLEVADVGAGQGELVNDPGYGPTRSPARRMGAARPPASANVREFWIMGTSYSPVRCPTSKSEEPAFMARLLPAGAMCEHWRIDAGHRRQDR